jgi:hypothetical protein
METIEEAREKIYKELTSDDSDVRAESQHKFENDVKIFSDAMGRSLMAWRTLDDEVKVDEKRSYISALVYAAITLHIVSFKVFLSGQIVAAGNLFRQVVETIALALLCSGKHLGVLDRFMADKYSTNDAVRDVLRQGDNLSLKSDALEALKSSQDFYHKYSHISRLTLANLISFSEEGIYVGACFDKGKIDAYKTEVSGRVGLANVFPSFIEGVKHNVAKW